MPIFQTIFTGFYISWLSKISRAGDDDSKTENIADVAEASSIYSAKTLFCA